MNAATGRARVNWYRTVWRWHFYAGLFCVPFVIWLGLTGAVYLFKPQIEAWIDRPYMNLAGDGPPLPPSVLAQAAVDDVPGAVLHRYVLPAREGDARQVIVGAGADETRVYVDPFTGKVLHTVAEEARLMRVVFRLHGELLAGRYGSTLVEIAACWTIVMLLTGLYLWWPRAGAGPAGTVYPRLRAGKRVFWRDLHAVTGLWVSACAVFLILSGLPWAMNWGSYLQAVREMTGSAAGQQDWSAGSEKDAALRAAHDAGVRAMLDPHAEHGGMTMHHMHDTYGALDVIAPATAALRLAPPVEISPPTGPASGWIARSNAADRTVRETVGFDTSGGIVMRETFADRHWIDRLVGFGVAVHEGAYFGLANQLLGLATVAGLIAVTTSAAVMWWRRRPEGSLGAPRASGPAAPALPVAAAVLLLAVAMPLFGATVVLVLAFECAVLRRWKGAAAWLGTRDGAPIGERRA